MAISQSDRTIPANTASSDSDLAELTTRYSIPKISFQTNQNRAISPRAFQKVPGLPAGWKAVFGTSIAMLPVIMTSQQLHMFYLRVAQAVLTLDDRWRWTFQMGHLVLELTSRDRKQMVTKELMLATIVMLRDFARGGFTDLFVARLWHESDSFVVNIQLRIASKAIEGLEVT
ncbi:MAG: hypothetical protein Q9225_000460 [Loekoesia sp. 1 TL-2023]